MGGKAKYARMSAEAYAARATRARGLRDSVTNYCEAIRSLIDDSRPAEERCALAKTYGEALTDIICKIEKCTSAPQAELDGDALGILDPKTVERIHDACHYMAWVLSDDAVPDFGAINKWLARGNANRPTNQFYKLCSSAALEDFANAFSARARSIYREYARIDPVHGGIFHALGLLSQTPVDAEAVTKACKRCQGKQLMIAFARANTRAEFEHEIVAHVDDYISLRDNGGLSTHIHTLMNHRFGPTDE